MDVFQKSLRIALALVVALPLGPGGICCCLFGEAQAAEAGPAPASCCQAEAPVPEPEGCPSTSEDPECACPEREVAELAPSLAGGPFVGPVPESGNPLAEPVRVLPELLAPEFRVEAPPPDPLPPATRRHAALSVYLC